MLKKYQKESTYSYSIGVFPTIELLKNKSGFVTKVLINPKGDSNKGLSEIINICENKNIKIETNKNLIEKLSLNENTYAVGIFEKYKTDLTKNSDHLILVNPSDMGNLGTIIRTMLAFNFKNIVLVKPAADIFDPKVIRSSMGAVFDINYEYINSFEEYKKTYENKIYTFMLDGKLFLNDSKFSFDHPCALVFGNEGEGLSDDFKNIGTSIKIPQSSNVDSLNLATAVSIGLFMCMKQG